MNKNEKQLFKSLCSFLTRNVDPKLLEAATPAVLGQLFFNRMQSIAYGSLRENGLLGQVNREFRNSLKHAYEYDLQKNKVYFACVRYLEQILSNQDCRYAMLKGAFLCKYYPEGYRTSNDIDLFVLPEDVTKIGKVLQAEGFRQGNIRNGVFVPATREEIIASRMTRGEVMPYIKEINCPCMKYLEVDLNFSLDYKPGDTALVVEMLERAQTVQLDDLRVRTLCPEDFFAHLCCHLYKEATTLPWVEMKRDMTLYKYCDLYLLLHDMTKADVDRCFIAAQKSGLEMICAYVVTQTAALFDCKNEYALTKAAVILERDPDFIHTVISPAEKKTYVYTEKDVAARFFAVDRKKLLKEVEPK